MTTYLLPYPPTTGNHTTGQLGRRRFTVDKIAEYRKAVLVACALVKIDHKRSGPVRVSMQACPPDLRARDHDNVEKVVLDALVRARAIADDSNKVCTSHGFYWQLQPEDGIERGMIRVYVVNAGRSEWPLPRARPEDRGGVR